MPQVVTAGRCGPAAAALRLGIHGREARRLRAILHNAKQHGLASQNGAAEPHVEARIRGKIAFVRMINPDQARPLLEALHSIPS